MQMKNFSVDQSLKELTEHRTVVLPLACYETIITQNIHGYIPLHWHDELQFVVILKGEALFQINEDKVVVRCGDGLFLNSGCLHMAEDSQQSDCTYICLNVSPHFVLSQELYNTYVYPYIQATNLPFVYLNSKEGWGENIVELIFNVHQLIKSQSPFYELDVTLLLSSMWKSLIVNGFQLEYDQTEITKSQRMKEMLAWIHQHFREKIMLDDIARAGQLSRSECCRYFKRMLKETPMNYVTRHRIQQSLILLQQEDSNVTEVAYEVGFNSTSYFIDQFRKIMKMTPLAYKKSKL